MTALFFALIAILLVWELVRALLLWFRRLRGHGEAP